MGGLPRAPPSCIRWSRDSADPGPDETSMVLAATACETVLIRRGDFGTAASEINKRNNRKLLHLIIGTVYSQLHKCE